MDTVTRRRFLIASGVTGGAALATASAGVTWHQLHQRAAQAQAGVGPTPPPAASSKILVVVTLYGGNDGLNTVIPYADPAYHDARPDLAYSASEVLPLDSSLGLNPSMTGLQKLWQNKQLAIVRGVDYPNPDFSHFRSMDIWQTASPTAPVNTGWIGRWLDATGDDPIRAVNIGSVLPPLAVGAKCTAAALATGTVKALTAPQSSAITGLAMSDHSDTIADAMVVAGYKAERQVASTFGSIVAGSASADAPDGGGGASLKQQLDLVGRCVKAGVPTTVYSVDLGGFDTHAGEKSTQQTLLGVMDDAISGFLTDMATDPRGRNVVMLVYSEFGRRVMANASQGTDHGSAGPVFVAGVPVVGGFYGEQPSLTDLDNGNLKSSVDFRTIYAELLHKVLNTDPTPIVGATQPALGLIA